MTKLLLSVLFLTLSTPSFAYVVKGQDYKNDCTKYTVKSEVSSSDNVVSKKNLYGLYFYDQVIDFDRERISFKIKQAVALGFNRDLIQRRIKVPRRQTALFNKIQKKVNNNNSVFQSICIRDGRLISAD